MIATMKINQDDNDNDKENNDDDDDDLDIPMWFYLNYIWRIRPCTMGDIVAASLSDENFDEEFEWILLLFWRSMDYLHVKSSAVLSSMIWNDFHKSQLQSNFEYIFGFQASPKTL